LKRSSAAKGLMFDKWRTLFFSPEKMTKKEEKRPYTKIEKNVNGEVCYCININIAYQEKRF